MPAPPRPNPHTSRLSVRATNKVSARRRDILLRAETLLRAKNSGNANIYNA